MDDKQKIQKLRNDGLGCTQVMVAMGLDKLNEKNPRFIQAAKGLCLGAHCESICGALSGAILLVTMYDEEEALEYMIPELVSWFKSEYGSINCMDLLENDLERKSVVCPPVIEATYFKAAELLKEVGYDLNYDKK